MCAPLAVSATWPYRSANLDRPPPPSPFSQRVWIALEVKGMSYQYCETDPFKRPTQLLEANPRGTVPAIREGDWASGESAIILEYVRGSENEAGRRRRR